MKRKLTLLFATVLALLLSGSVIQRTSSVDAISGATKRSKPKAVSVANTPLSGGEEQAEPELVLGDQGFPSDLDPAHADNGRFTLAYGVGETLVLPDDELKIRPWLAESWENIDSLTWNITLRPSVKYHNGAEMTAKSVKESLERAIRLSDEASRLIPSASIQADGLSLTIRTPEPCPNLMNYLANPAFVIVDTKAAEGKNFSYFPVCTGPFIPAGFTGNTEIRLQRFEGYHGGVPTIKSAAVRYEADADKLVNAIKSGGMDAVMNISPETLETLAQQGCFTQHTDGLSSYLLMLNTKHPALSVKKVRKAIALALNPYDPEQAQALLAEAGYSDTDGAELSLRLAVPREEPGLLEQARKLEARLEQVGINVAVISYSEVFFTSRARYGKFDLLLFTVNTTENGDSQQFYKDFFTLDGKQNYGHYRSEEVESAVHRLENEFDPRERILLAGQIRALVTEDAAFLFLGNPQVNSASRQSIAGLAVHPVYGYRLTADTVAGH